MAQGNEPNTQVLPPPNSQVLSQPYHGPEADLPQSWVNQETPDGYHTALL